MMFGWNVWKIVMYFGFISAAVVFLIGVIYFFLSLWRKKRIRGYDGLSEQSTSLVKANQRLNFSEAVEAGDSRIESMHFRSRQKRVGRNVDREIATLKKVKEAVETEVAIQKQVVDGHKIVGNYENLPPLEKKQVEAEQQKLDADIMEAKYRQEKARKELEVLTRPKQRELSPTERMRQGVKNQIEMAKARVENMEDFEKAKKEILDGIKEDEIKKKAKRILDDSGIELMEK